MSVVCVWARGGSQAVFVEIVFLEDLTRTKQVANDSSIKLEFTLNKLSVFAALTGVLEGGLHLKVDTEGRRRGTRRLVLWKRQAIPTPH